MNGLSLRINKNGGSKVKNTSYGVDPVILSTKIEGDFVSKNPEYSKFFSSKTSDEQLSVLRNVLNTTPDQNTDGNVLVNFLVQVFLEAPLKHPVKCFVIRHILKNKELQPKFTANLSLNIQDMMSIPPTDYKGYVCVMNKLSSCIENFPPGADALKDSEDTAVKYMEECLDCCVSTLRESQALAPTEKNDIFNLCHLTLRLLLHLVQKLNSSDKLEPSGIRANLLKLIYDEDVPMDTRSVCGILFVTMHCLEHGENSWISILHSEIDSIIEQFIRNDPARLAVYSAILTVIPVNKIQNQYIEKESALLILTNKILDIGERNSSDTTTTLGVTRTVLQIAKSLDKILSHELGQSIVDSVLMHVWSHLEHYMDSVRHLTAQTLSCIVRYCSAVQKEGNTTPLDNLFSTLTSLEASRKSYYVSMTCLTAELGAAAILEKIDSLVLKLVAALSMQAVQASATTTLEALLNRHMRQTDAQTIYNIWIEPIIQYVTANTLESSALNILEDLLANVVRNNQELMDFILPHIKKSYPKQKQHGDLKCTLMLLSVSRKSGVANKMPNHSVTEWKGMIEYDVLKMAAVNAMDETRILSLSLIVESSKSTEVYSVGDLDLVLHYLSYNINTQSPNFRQLTLSLMKKFMKRLDESYRMFKKKIDSSPTENKVDYYVTFLEDLRRLCFESLLKGSNYSRRSVALQILLWSEGLFLDRYERKWCTEYVEKLLNHLDDSYEINKDYALQILEKCPVELFEAKTYSISLEIDDILKEASSVKPTDCTSAAYKFKLLKRKLPHRIATLDSNIPESAAFSLLRMTLVKLQSEVGVAKRSVLTASSQGPMYGLIHCMRHVFKDVHVLSISTSPEWRDLVESVLSMCDEVSSVAKPIVNNDSPEGHLPMDMGAAECQEPIGVRLDNGGQVTAQMVLLCAWRSVKEISLLTGELCARMPVSGEPASPSGVLSSASVLDCGRRLADLLAETKHRGAFEQAYVGFSTLVTRLWRSLSPPLHSVPPLWLSRTMTSLLSVEGGMCATRRSAGVPYIIQALVTTELQVNGNPKCFHECMATLLKLAQYDPKHRYSKLEIEARTHSLNILRALFRNTTLGESASVYVADGLLVAIKGFEAPTWPERNSATLLFSCVCVRVFGVARARTALPLRNRMTGRIFFLRYPRLYDYMLEKLQEVTENASEDLQPSLYPILLVLGRLYPSSLEGTVSNLKLSSFISPVLKCGMSGVLKSRSLAAAAMAALVDPNSFLPHIETMFDLLSNESIKRNHCHGILLQLIRLLETKPEAVTGNVTLKSKVQGSFWILEQAAGIRPCFLIADEYVKVINLIVMKFPEIIDEEILNDLKGILRDILTNKNKYSITCGMDVFLANAMNLYLVVQHKIDVTSIPELINHGLSHTSYEVILSTLNYLLILYEINEDLENCSFQEHLRTVSNKNILEYIRADEMYKTKLCSIINGSKYAECVQKSLKILSMESNTQILLIGNTGQDLSPDEIAVELMNLITCCHENLVQVYLYSLLEFVRENQREMSAKITLKILKVIHEHSSSENGDSVRQVVVEFVADHLKLLCDIDTDKYGKSDHFAYKSLILATLVTLLEDDSAIYRQKVSNSTMRMYGELGEVLPSKCCEVLRNQLWVHGADDEEKAALYVLLALLDFKSEVCLNDDVNDECRVFDQNERYNIFLEETIWTKECAVKIRTIANKKNVKTKDYVQKVIENLIYKNTLSELCLNNLVLYERMTRGHVVKVSDALNPKIGMFVRLLNC